MVNVPLEEKKDPKVELQEEIRNFLIKSPLYDKKTLSEEVEDDKNFMRALRQNNILFDCHCVECDKESTFKDYLMRGSGSGDGISLPNWMYKEAELCVTCECTRCRFKMEFNIRVTQNVEKKNCKVTKYGQWPSLEDIASNEISKYRSMLDESNFSELHRATGLASHGIGIGSFVYLRRIFERLITKHRDDTKTDPKEIEDFNRLRMDKKIKNLKDYLPNALVVNSSIYSILSKGLHELDEETCVKYFGIVRSGIIMILEQDLQAKKLKEAEMNLKKEISMINSTISKDN